MLGGKYDATTFVFPEQVQQSSDGHLEVGSRNQS